MASADAATAVAAITAFAFEGCVMPLIVEAVNDLKGLGHSRCVWGVGLSAFPISPAKQHILSLFL